jgi:hypothetical protein
MQKVFGSDIGYPGDAGFPDDVSNHPEKDQGYIHKY